MRTRLIPVIRTQLFGPFGLEVRLFITAAGVPEKHVTACFTGADLAHRVLDVNAVLAEMCRALARTYELNGLRVVIAPVAYTIEQTRPVFRVIDAEGTSCR